MTDADIPPPQQEDAWNAAATGRTGISKSAGRRWGSRSKAALAIAALYLAIVLILPASLFWSPDEGAKFLQLVSYHGKWPDLNQRLQYGGRSLDPRFRFYPQPLPRGHRFEVVSRLYPRPTVGGEIESNWPPLFSLLALPPFSIFGFHGLYLLPVAAGIGTALLAGSIARRVTPRAEAPVIVAVALCTPMLIYSSLFWEHSLAVFLGMAALVLCTSRQKLSLGTSAAATACLAGAVALRHEMVVFSGALTVSIIAAAVLDRMVAAGVVSEERGLTIGVPVLSSAVAAAAIGAASTVVRKLELTAMLGEKEGYLAHLLLGVLASPRLWRDLPIRLQRALIDLPADNGPALDPWIAWLGLLGVLVAALSIALREPVRGWTLAAGGGVLTLVSLWVVVSPDRFRSLHALVLPAPYAVFAVLLLYLPLSLGGQARWILTWTTVLVAISSVVLSLPLLVGGLEWGSRYQLTAYVLAAVACTVGLIWYARSDQPARPRAAVTVAATLALAVGALYQVRGVRELAVSKADLWACQHLITSASRPVVTDLYWLPSALADSFRRVPIFTLRDPDELATWIDLVGPREHRFVVVTDEAPPAGVDRWIAGAGPHDVVLIDQRAAGGLWFLDLRASPDRRPGAP